MWKPQVSLWLNIFRICLPVDAESACIHALSTVLYFSKHRWFHKCLITKESICLPNLTYLCHSLNDFILVTIFITTNNESNNNSNRNKIYISENSSCWVNRSGQLCLLLLGDEALVKASIWKINEQIKQSHNGLFMPSAAMG